MADQKIKITISAAATGLQQSFSTASKALRAFRSEMGMTEKAAASLSGSFKTALGGLGMGLIIRDLFQAGVNAQQLQTAFASVAGSAPAAAAELDFVRGVADKLGQEFYQTAGAYKGIFAAAKGTTLEGQGVRDIFIGITEASTALGISSEQTEGALLAVSQMISKGTVSAEELRGQLGERLPGAFNLAAEAMGVTTAELGEMLQKGEVMASEFIPRFAKVLHEQYGKAAEDASKTAIAAFNRFTTAWTDVKVAVANSGFLEIATDYMTALANAMKDPAVKAAIKEWATRFFELADATAKWVLQHKEVLAGLAGAAIIIPKIVAAWNGLNAAMTVLTGMQLVPWLTGVNAAVSGVMGSTLTLAGALATAAAAAASLFAGYKLGEWLTMRGEMQGIADETDTLQRATAKLGREFLDISRSTGVSVTSMEELDQAVAAGRIHYDEMTSTWKAGAREQAAAVSASSAEQQQAQGTALDAMKKKYKEYTDEVKRLQDQIAGQERSLAAELREMGRSDMSDLKAWQDRRREAEEYLAAARRAAQAGDWETAKAQADDARAAFKELNGEVKDGEYVQVSAQAALKESMDGVKAAGELSISILKSQQDEARKAAEALDKESGGKLTGAIDEAKRKTEELNKLIAESGGDWGKVWEQMEQDAASAIAASGKRMDELTRDRHVTVYVKEVVAKAMGGMVQKFARGGKLPGYGGGDRIAALLEAGEFVVRKEAVSRFGAGIFHMLNSLKLPKFAAGGPVSAMAGAGRSEIHQVDLRLLDTASPVRLSGSKYDIAELQRQLTERRRLRSA